MKISLAQMAVKTLEVEANLEKGARLIEEAAKEGSDLVVMPELWTTGFNMPGNVKIAQEHEQAHLQIAQLAKKHNIWITGSVLALNTEEKPSNAALLFSPDGEIVSSYRKMHLFSLVNEGDYLSPGNEIIQFDAPWGKTGFTICYDLRFPELFRNLAVNGSELIICPAGFPNPRKEHWRTLLRARAIENQCFIAATNRAGSEHLGKGQTMEFFGASSIIDPWGKTLAEADDSECLISRELDLTEASKIRNQMKVFEDRRPELY
ncbi:carbon-nitrogen family hydrolase [Rubellicoccus peritrichatus]|uniref:Carbon-nitrogen family hydrolase n=1 Tax=Rubellicoccus peritrichatus TaxID=3080537 RepID=A0AAQ3LBX9_9BACT|nr:carbon-nitrogen family hydrolase [Puniceicoccus sp. CR14]WOO41572.1 carbon-nitrogen family hydrolase [Puniceicoccus sp. CR14]